MDLRSSNSTLSKAIDVVKQAKEIIVGLAGAGSVIWGAYKALTDDTGLLTVALIAGGLVLWGGLVYLWLGKKGQASSILGLDGKQIIRPRDRRIRRLAKTGAICIPLAAVAVVSLMVVVEIHEPRQAVIAFVPVTNEDGISVNHKITRLIQSSLDDVLREYGRSVEIIRVDEPIVDKARQDEVALEIAKSNDADIVIWGWCATDESDGKLSFRLPAAKGWWDMDERFNAATGELDTFKTRIAGDVKGLSLLTIGLALYKRKDFDRAIRAFKSALEGFGTNEALVNSMVIRLYKGLCHYKKAMTSLTPIQEFRTSIGEFTQIVQTGEHVEISRTTDHSGPDDEHSELNRLRWIAHFDRAVAYMELGHRQDDSDGRGSLIRARDSYEFASEYLNVGIEHWAVRYNLGLTIHHLATRSEDDPTSANLLFEDAVNTLRHALELCSGASNKVERKLALTHNGLGMSLARWARMTPTEIDRDERFKQAEERFRSATKIIYESHGRSTQWAMLESNLANVLVEMGEAWRDRQPLQEALTKYDAVLQVYKSRPVDYAETRYNQGYALKALASLLQDSEARQRVRESITAFQDCVSRSPEGSELWAFALRDLAKSHIGLAQVADNGDRANHFREAEKALQDSRRFFDHNGKRKDQEQISGLLSDLRAELQNR